MDTRKGHVALLCLVIFTWRTVVAVGCEQLQCLNGNPCQTLPSGDNHTTHARCVCGGQWAGSRCEQLIHVTPQSVTSSQVTLKIDVMAADMDSHSAKTSRGSGVMSLVSSSDDENLDLNYTVVFWRRNDSAHTLSPDSLLLSPPSSGEISCVMLHRKNSRTPMVEGLQPKTRYVICIENGFVDSCYLASLADSSSSLFSSSSVYSLSVMSLSPSWPSNCVTIFTTSMTAHAHMFTSSTVTVVAAVSVFILFILTIVFVVFLIGRQNTALRMYINRLLCEYRYCYCCCCLEDGVSGAATTDSAGLVTANQVSTYMFRPARTLTTEGTLNTPNTRKTFVEKIRTKVKKSSRSVARSPSSSLTLSVSFDGQQEAELSPDPSLDEQVPPSDSHGSHEPAPALRHPLAFAPPPAGRRGVPKYRLSKKRRGHVTYFTRKDQKMRLTPVFESPQDELASASLMNVDEANL